jgi:hypothetical protein
MARARTRSTTEADTVATHGAGVEDSNASDVEKGV